MSLLKARAGDASCRNSRPVQAAGANNGTGRTRRALQLKHQNSGSKMRQRKQRANVAHSATVLQEHSSLSCTVSADTGENLGLGDAAEKRYSGGAAGLHCLLHHPAEPPGITPILLRRLGGRGNESCFWNELRVSRELPLQAWSSLINHPIPYRASSKTDALQDALYGSTHQARCSFRNVSLGVGRCLNLHRY